MLLNLRFLLRYQYLHAQRSGSRFYFGGGVTDADLLDFEIWKHQAEKLGVVLTKKDARLAVVYEAGGQGLPPDPGGSWKDDPAFKDAFARHPQATEEQAATALEDEFRVRIAQGLLGGPASGVAALDADERASPNAIAPYDFWTYFRDNRTTLKVAFLALPVQAFKASVTTTPTPDELKAIFKKGEALVPDPTSPTPGFRQPHRIRTAVLTAWTDPRQFAPEQLYFSAGLPGNVASAGVAPLALVGTALAVDPVRAEYNHVLDHLTAAHSAQVSLAGDVVGLGTLGPAMFPALAGVLQASTDEKNRETGREAASALAIALNSSTPGAPFAGLIGALAPPSAWTQQAFPRIVQPDLSEFPKAVVDEMKRRPRGGGKEERRKQEPGRGAAQSRQIRLRKGPGIHRAAGQEERLGADNERPRRQVRGGKGRRPEIRAGGGSSRRGARSGVRPVRNVARIVRPDEASGRSQGAAIRDLLAQSRTIRRDRRW